MKILIIGGGGREHAIAWKIAQSPRVKKIYCAPGNAGMVEIAECVPIPADDVTGLFDFARSRRIDLTVVGPEIPLSLGIADSFRRAGLKIFAPCKEAAKIESSKVFAKDFCSRYGIPAACSETFTDAEKAKLYIKSCKMPIVIKADGLASGKGVLICKNHEEAIRAANGMLVRGRFGEAGRTIIVEEFLEGCEASFIAICDGNHVLPLEGSEDHKPVFDGDTGPNTGGMGAISPTKVLNNGVCKKVMEKIILPAARGLVTDGMPFVGTLYAGLMVKDGEPKVLEFNARFGDPETQALVMRLKTDIAHVFTAAVTGELNKISLEWDTKSAACVVMTSGGYPGDYERGKVITGIGEALKLSDVMVFHAGTKRVNGNFVTDGGRVLAVTALGEGMDKAIECAYEAVSKIHFEGAHYRKDIGRGVKS